MKEILKWGALIIIGLFVSRWLSGLLSRGVGVNAAADASLYSGYAYSAPLTGPGATYGWAAPWQYGGGNYIRSGRGGGRHGRRH